MQPRRLLLVDDERYITSLVASKLELVGDEVHIASDGAEAFDLALEILPDLVVSDFQMPVMSGFELACEMKLRAETSAIPLIMLTARGHLLTPTELAQTNIRQLLAKPFSARELLASITDLLGPPRFKSSGGNLPGAIAI